MNAYALWGARRYDIQIGGHLDRLFQRLHATNVPLSRARWNRRAGW